MKSIIEKLNYTVTCLSNDVDMLSKEKEAMMSRCEMAERQHYEGSQFDRMLTLDTILKWIESRHHYNYTEQVFRMLADLKCNVATDEEKDRIKNLEDKMLDKNQIQAIFNQNFGLYSNMMNGMITSPQLPIGMSPADLQKMFLEFIEQLINNQIKP